ncbi:MAG: hypothetical protein IJB59_14585 [Oscillospiraceae bacterium]|nr:hypothetical protein [Oscillospiraceae bacterium]
MTDWEIKEKTIKMRTGELTMQRDKERWTDSDRETLRREYYLGTPVNEIAIMLERSEGAIHQQIEQQSLCMRNTIPRRKSVAKEPECLCKYCERNKSLCPLCEVYQKTLGVV